LLCFAQHISPAWRRKKRDKFWRQKEMGEIWAWYMNSRKTWEGNGDSFLAEKGK
jgi:hypothetical protein